MSTFRFKQFEVEQTDVAMKVGTDGVLLGAWAELGGARRVLDIGTGTGVIALMAAQRSSAETIVGVEIDAVASRCAAANFEASPWSERLTVTQCAVQEFDAEPFDVIISNPPYFVDSLLSPDSRRTVARHTTDLSFADLSAAVCRLLSTEGRFALILPTEEMAKFESETPLRVVRRCEVRSVPNGTVKRVMAEFAHTSASEPHLEQLTIETEVRGQFSEQYRTLTKDFYLKF